MSNSLIIQEKNIELIIKEAPKSYLENQASHDRCLAYGKGILSRIQEGGMTDELDQFAAEYIEKAKKTIKVMMERRSPVTKLFDEIRSVYTTMENDIDPTKALSTPSELQILRNAYAAKKRADAEAKRREEERLQRIESSKNRYRIAVEEDYRQSFQRILNKTFNEMNTTYNAVTLENFKEKEAELRSFPRTLPDGWLDTVPSGAMIPVELSRDDTPTIRKEVKSELEPTFKEQFSLDIGDNLDNVLFTLPSKKRELEAIATSSREEAERLREEMARREAEEASKVEQERKRREEEAMQSLKIQEQKNELGSLFTQSASLTPSYQPKTQVKKKIVVTSPVGYMEVLKLWWSTEGCNLSIEELSKKFKPQVAHCEKLANSKSDQRFIQSEYVVYEDEVKAK